MSCLRRRSRKHSKVFRPGCIQNSPQKEGRHSGCGTPHSATKGNNQPNQYRSARKTFDFFRNNSNIRRANPIFARLTVIHPINDDGAVIVYLGVRFRSTLTVTTRELASLTVRFIFVTVTLLLTLTVTVSKLSNLNLTISWGASGVTVSPAARATLLPFYFLQLG
jgi:hypothetical protein